MRRKLEDMLQVQVVDYLRLQYPEIVPFVRSDFAAGMKLTMGQAIRHKRMQGARAWPDLQIAYPRAPYHGFFLELKAEDAPLYKKDGTLYKNGHLEEQQACLDRLSDMGYFAQFAQGFEGCKRIIDWYLRSKKLINLNEEREEF